MALKDLLVVVDDTAAASARIDAAAQLAARTDSHITGLYPIIPLTLPGYVEAELPDEVRAMQRGFTESQTAKAEALFADAVRRNGLTDRSEWRGLYGHPMDTAALHGRYADVVVVGQADPHRDRDHPIVLPQDLVFECGRPLLVVPYAGNFPHIGERVLVAWNGSREAARAVADAMPILTAAKRVVVMAVNPKSGPAGIGDEPGADIAKHLSRHGCRVEATHIVTDQIDPGDTLLNTVADESCDLLVMGAYGRSRLREQVLGGMTRYMLEHMTVPVLMSH